MSVQTIDCVIMKLRPGVDVTTGEGKAAFEELLPIIASQKGCKAAYYGAQIEDPTIAYMILDWESIDAHIAFGSTPDFAPFLQKILTIVAAKPSYHHVLLPSTQQHSITATLDSPVTELLSLYFDPAYERAAFDAKFKDLVAFMARHGVEESRISAGWGLEKHRHRSLARDGEEEGGEAVYYGGFFGWSSVEEHLRMRGEEGFAEIAAGLEAEARALEIVHVQLTRFRERTSFL